MKKKENKLNENMQVYKEAFDLIDKNKDGEITDKNQLKDQNDLLKPIAVKQNIIPKTPNQNISIMFPKTNYINNPKETQRETYEETIQKNETEKREDEERRESNALHKKERKRKIKQANEENKDYGNNCEQIQKKAKKAKRPKKDRIRF